VAKDRTVQDCLAGWAKANDSQVHVIAGANQALERVRRGSWDIAFVDIDPPINDGMDRLRWFQELTSKVPTIAISRPGPSRVSPETSKSWARDFLSKPIRTEELVDRITRAQRHWKIERQSAYLRGDPAKAPTKRQFIAASSAMKHVADLVHAVASTDTPVLIIGEPGTGKETVAKAIHAASQRRHRPIVVVRCGALSEKQLERTLFGRGSDFGADDESLQNECVFDAADGGTIVLREVSAIGQEAQAGLIRVIEKREVRLREPSRLTQSVDVRWIATTSSSLDQPPTDGCFRSDLRHCLGVFPIEIPPLRARREDILLLAHKFVRKYALRMNQTAPPISADAISALCSYPWPGNVRELKNAIERAMLTGDGLEIKASDFPFQLKPDPAETGRTLKAVERRHIVTVVEENQGNIREAARILGIDRTTLYSRLKQYGLR